MPQQMSPSVTIILNTLESWISIPKLSFVIFLIVSMVQSTILKTLKAAGPVRKGAWVCGGLGVWCSSPIIFTAQLLLPRLQQHHGGTSGNSVKALSLFWSGQSSARH